MPDSLSASEYILDNFKPSDRLAVLLRNRGTEEVIQRIASAEKIAAPDFQQWLKERNQAGFDIYIGMNALKDGAYSRTKHDIHAIRHVYLDLDYRGPKLSGRSRIPKKTQSRISFSTRRRANIRLYGKSKVLRPKKRKTYSSGWPMSSARTSPQLTRPAFSGFQDSTTGNTAPNALYERPNIPTRRTTSETSRSRPVRPKATEHPSKDHRA